MSIISRDFCEKWNYQTLIRLSHARQAPAFAFEDLIGRFGPFEGPGILVMPIDKSEDIGLELPNGGMNSSSEPLSGEFSEPTSDLIDP